MLQYLPKGGGIPSPLTRALLNELEASGRASHCGALRCRPAVAAARCLRETVEPAERAQRPRGVRLNGAAGAVPPLRLGCGRACRRELARRRHVAVGAPLLLRRRRRACRQGTSLSGPDQPDPGETDRLAPTIEQKRSASAAGCDRGRSPVPRVRRPPRFVEVCGTTVPLLPISTEPGRPCCPVRREIRPIPAITQPSPSAPNPYFAVPPNRMVEPSCPCLKLRKGPYGIRTHLQIGMFLVSGTAPGQHATRLPGLG